MQPQDKLHKNESSKDQQIFTITPTSAEMTSIVENFIENLGGLNFSSKLLSKPSIAMQQRKKYLFGPFNMLSAVIRLLQNF